MGQNNIIELNGKQYDAITGALLGESRIKATPASQARRGHQGRVIDGFMRKSAQQQAQLVKAMPVVKPEPIKVEPVKTTAKPKMMDVKRVGPQQAKTHQQERSKTLMRHAVKKPKVEMKPNIKTTGPTGLFSIPVIHRNSQIICFLIKAFILH